MLKFYLKLGISIALIVASGSVGTWAREGYLLKIPMRSKATPVQRLNRDGVEAIKKHNYERAETLFYRAYLYDPADPFTLNNLGYVAELEGQLDKAKKFYDLAAEQSSNASIDRSNTKRLEGKPMRDALVKLQDVPLRVNRTNITAMRLISQGRSFEALAELKQILPLDQRNPFTLNNLGVASEAVGDWEGALRYYRSAAATRSQEPTIVTVDREWRGKSVSELAEASASRLERRLRDMGPTEARAMMLTNRGVAAINQNDWASAQEDFMRAYSLDPTSAFTLNNRGYVAEREGDMETAQYYYDKAQRANNAGARVGLATDIAAEGKSLGEVAVGSGEKVDSALEVYREQRRRQTGPVELTPRGATQTEPEQPAQPQTPQMNRQQLDQAPQVQPAPQREQLPQQQQQR